jgi:hypothetical protein
MSAPQAAVCFQCAKFLNRRARGFSGPVPRWIDKFMP